MKASSSVLEVEDALAIESAAALSDQAEMLSPALRDLLHARGWLAMLAPHAAGGAELPLPQAVRLEEAIACADGSTGWVVTLCAGAGWFAGFLDPDFARGIIETPGVCLAGSGAPSGFADREGDSYRLSGRWDIATGATMATHFTFNAMLREHGQALLDPDGAARICAFVVPAGDVKVLPSWQKIGLRATSSHSFSIDGVTVEARHAFTIAPQSAIAPGPLYRFPFVTLAFVTLAANLAGMAHHFLDLAEPMIVNRRHPLAGRLLGAMPQVMQRLEQVKQGVASTRAHFYLLLDDLWAQVCANPVADAARAQALDAASLALVVASRNAVDTLYPYCGLQAADAHSEINRVWRDFHTATQHAMLLPVQA